MMHFSSTVVNLPKKNKKQLKANLKCFEALNLLSMVQFFARFNQNYFVSNKKMLKFQVFDLFVTNVFINIQDIFQRIIHEKRKNLLIINLELNG